MSVMKQDREAAMCKAAIARLRRLTMEAMEVMSYRAAEPVHLAFGR